MQPIPTFHDIRHAAERIRAHAHRTPVLTCDSLNRMAGAQLFFKCENFQKAGAFKFRGACNTLFSLSKAELRGGVATHSSGNHAAALALAARLRGTRAFIVMPQDAPKVKIAAVAGYGGEITFCQPTLEARETTLAEVVRETGATFVHPYNDPRVIAGQGTATLELLHEIPDLDVVLAPVGGGGLLSGTAIAAAGMSPKIKVIAVEPANADDAFRSFRAGKRIPVEHPDTIADGLRTSLGELTFAIIMGSVHDIVTVSEEAIVAAMRHVWERMKIIIEPSSAVPVAALLENKLAVSGKRVGVILSGGNVELSKLPF
ncbi:pyridoxal-phosphate dependent enzyme [candidate division KSB1 bacterium]|nr:pyridoxal-phosphate dependent enzyme [candidate division KSB1 bacterium]